MTYLTLVQPVSKTHWATRPRQSSLSTAACSASSHAMPIDFKSPDTVSIQFDLGLPGLLVHESIRHRVACFGILSSSMRNTCPSHLNLLSLMMRSILCSSVWFRMSSLRTLSFHVKLFSLFCCQEKFEVFLSCRRVEQFSIENATDF